MSEATTTPSRSLLHFALDAGERLVVTVPPSQEGEPARRFSMTLLHKSGRHARLRITADDDLGIERVQTPSPC